MYNPAPSLTIFSIICTYVCINACVCVKMHDQCKRALIYIMRLLKEKQFSISKFNFVMEDLMHTMSLVHILLGKAIVCNMPSVFVFILAEQKNEQHTPIILFTPSIYVTKILKKIFCLTQSIFFFSKNLKLIISYFNLEFKCHFIYKY